MTLWTHIPAFVAAGSDGEGPGRGWANIGVASPTHAA